MIRLGPPGPGEEATVKDEDLRYLILGWLRGATLMPQFPIALQGDLIDNFDAMGDIESFTVVTRSGLRFTVHVDYEGGP